MKIVGVGPIAIAVLLASASYLNASIITETITGTVTTGTDNAGVFGPMGANLAGEAVTVTYMLNTSVLAMDGLYESTPSTFEALISFANDGAITNTITVGGSTFTQTQNAGSREEFSTTMLSTGSDVNPVLFNSTSGTGSSIDIHSTATYQFGVLLGNPKPFLDQVSADATQVKVGIDTSNGSFTFQTDLTIQPNAVVIPEPTPFIVLALAGVFLVAVRSGLVTPRNWSGGSRAGRYR